MSQEVFPLQFFGKVCEGILLSQTSLKCLVEFSHLDLGFSLWEAFKMEDSLFPGYS